MERRSNLRYKRGSGKGGKESTAYIHMKEERQEDTGGTQSEIDQVMVKINQKNHDTDNSATLTAIVFKEQKISLNSIYLYASFYYSYSNTFIRCFFWYLLAFL